jgi:hypothetical protein
MSALVLVVLVTTIFFVWVAEACLERLLRRLGAAEEEEEEEADAPWDEVFEAAELTEEVALDFLDLLFFFPFSVSVC